MRRFAVLASVVLIALSTGACGAGEPWTVHRFTDPDQRWVETDEHLVTGPVDGREAAEFSLVTGITSVTVRAADLGDSLYRIWTPDDSSMYPAIVEDESHMQLHLRKRADGGPAAVTVELNRDVVWRLRFDAGVTTNLVDMTAGKVSSVDLAAGVSRVELRLPAPVGTVPVRLGGGANELAVSVPAGTPARVRVGNGAATVDIDGERRSGVPAGTVFPAANYESTMDRYDIDLATGVSTVRLDHR